MIAASTNPMEHNSASGQGGQMGTGVDIRHMDARSERHLGGRENRQLPFRPTVIETGNAVKNFQNELQKSP